MTRQLTSLVMIAALAGVFACCSRSSKDAGGTLVGDWLMMADGVEFPGGCFSDLPIQYHADGTYSVWGEGGTWRLSGTLLVETATSVDRLLVDPSASQIGTPHPSRIRWNGSDRFWKRSAGGHIDEFRRCVPAH